MKQEASIFVGCFLFFSGVYVSIMLKKEGRLIFVYASDAITSIAIFLSSFFIFTKSLKYNFTRFNKLLSILWCLIWSLISTAGIAWGSLLIFKVLFCSASIIFIVFMTKIKPDTVMSAFLFSFCISHFLDYIASFAITVIASLFLKSEVVYGSLINLNKPLYLLIYSLISAFQLILSFLLFRIRRFKNGFPFLFKRYAVILALIVSGTVLTLVTWVKIFFEARNYKYYPLLFLGIFIVGIGIIIWIRRGIKSFYLKKIKERDIETLEQELAEKECEIQRLNEKNNILRTANHKITHRLAALEQSVSVLACKLQNSVFSTEMSEELSATLEYINCLSHEYQDDINRIKDKKSLPSTKIKMLDDLFEYFSEQCSKNNIDFNLNINGSIPYMTEHLISQSQLETMIGDHMQDAIIAVNASDSPFRSVLVLLGLVDNCYELTFYDSGIPFTTDTLMRIGTECITTHADIGGSGVGFMTTFETMRECRASLIINEKFPNDADYSKSVTIRFDGKSQYIIESYRPDAFNVQSEYIKSVVNRSTSEGMPEQFGDSHYSSFP